MMNRLSNIIGVMAFIALICTGVALSIKVMKASNDGKKYMTLAPASALTTNTSTVVFEDQHVIVYRVNDAGFDYFYVAYSKTGRNIALSYKCD